MAIRALQHEQSTLLELLVGVVDFDANENDYFESDESWKTDSTLNLTPPTDCVNVYVELVVLVGAERV